MLNNLIMTTKLVSDSKNSVNPFLSNKGSANNSFPFIENEEIISDEKKVALVFNDYYLKKLKIEKNLNSFKIKFACTFFC